MLTCEARIGTRLVSCPPARPSEWRGRGAPQTQLSSAPMSAESADCMMQWIPSLRSKLLFEYRPERRPPAAPFVTALFLPLTCGAWSMTMRREFRASLHPSLAAPKRIVGMPGSHSRALRFCFASMPLTFKKRGGSPSCPPARARSLGLIRARIPTHPTCS